MMLDGRTLSSSSPDSAGQGKPEERPAPEIPFISPQPPRLSEHIDELRSLEDSGIFSNYGPVNTLLEEELIEHVFETGSCVTVCNATIGLMLAIREVIGEDRPLERRYALMPSFTFAAAAQAALWCGLTPLFCDIDPDTWMADAGREEDLLQQYAGQVAVIVPYATFGNNLDLQRYRRLAEEMDVPIVVDAAASLGSLDLNGLAFGAGFPWPIVFSMHATKVFSVGEGGLIYSADAARMQRLRSMGSFGFSNERAAVTIGLNSKLSETAALTARLQLRQYDSILRQRELAAATYTTGLSAHFKLQRETGMRQVRAFFPVLLPRDLAPARAHIMEDLRTLGVGTGAYFSPHTAEHPLFRRAGLCGPLPVTADIASRVLSLPLWSGMALEQVQSVIQCLLHTVASRAKPPLVASRLDSEHKGFGHGIAA